MLLPCVTHDRVRGPRSHPWETLARALVAPAGGYSKPAVSPAPRRTISGSGWEIAEQLEHAVDAVLDSGDCGTEPTTVIDFSRSEPEIVRRGAGDTSGFE